MSIIKKLKLLINKKRSSKMQPNPIVIRSDNSDLINFIPENLKDVMKYAIFQADQIIRFYSIDDFNDFVFVLDPKTKVKIIESVNKFGFYFDKLQLSAAGDWIRYLFVKCW